MKNDLIESLSQLELVSMLAYDLFYYDEVSKKVNLGSEKEVALERAQIWMKTPLPMLFGKSPREVALINQGSGLIEFLKAKLGVKL